jgi:hypothetical protein
MLNLNSMQPTVLWLKTIEIKMQLLFSKQMQGTKAGITDIRPFYLGREMNSGAAGLRQNNTVLGC